MLKMIKVVLFIALIAIPWAICDAASSNPHSIPKGSVGHPVTVTAYTNIPSCADGNPNVTASCLKIKKGHYGTLIALSSDLAKHYQYGARFRLIVDDREYQVTFSDRMPKKHRKKVDLLLSCKKNCQKFGKKKGILIPIQQNPQGRKQRFVQLHTGK